MINNYIKHICLIFFALFGPIYLPAGGIQKNLNDYYYSHKSKEIVLNSNCNIYAMPIKNSKRLILLNPGSSLLVLRSWIDSDKDRWFRVQISNNIFVGNSLKPTKGWVKI